MVGFWNSKTDNEIFQTFKIPDLVFIGKFRLHTNGFSFFENLRNLDYSPVLNLRSNVNENSFVKVQVINKSNFEFQPNEYYKISAKVIPQKTRIFYNSEFLLQFTNECDYEQYIPEEKAFTEQIFLKYSEANTASSQDILKSVKTITYQINKRNETFIYELLQNADDYPMPNQKVVVEFYITDKYLLFTHSGANFNFNNVYALCSVNAEDKVDDIEKIGFKGIGFKSVFKANEFVYLKSGNYSFRFDKSFHNVEHPWQLMPIWTDNEELEVSLKNNRRFLNSNVAIALKPRNIEKTLSDYSQTLELFRDERILLFLRNIEKVNVFIGNDYRIFCDKTKNKWWHKEFDVPIDDEIIDYLNTQIIEGNEEIPSKFANVSRCKISFAALITDGKISIVNDAKLFNYLPLIINLNFPFIINTDFIPDGEREGLISNKWNEFLLIESGKKFIKYLQVTVLDKKRPKQFCYSVINLIPLFGVISEQLNNNEKWKSYFDLFRKGFKMALLGDDNNPAIQFIPTSNDGIEVLANILIDETGLAELLDSEFAVLTGRGEQLIHSEVGDGIVKIKSLIEENVVGFIYRIIDIKKDFKKEGFQIWLKKPENNFKIIKYLLDSEEANIEKLLESEEIILTEINELKTASSIYQLIPEEVSFVKVNRLNRSLNELLAKENLTVPFCEFNPVIFYKEFISEHKTEINSVLITEENLIKFWSFIYDYWDAFKEDSEITKSLKSINILCKDSDNEEMVYQSIQSTYLSKEYVSEGEIETIVSKISISDAMFISDKYICEVRSDIKQWKTIFEKANAITDLHKVIDAILPRINEIDESKHFEITNQIFKDWKGSTKFSEEQLGLIHEGLMLKCIQGNFVRANECFVSDHYNNNKLIQDTLPVIELTNLISNEYDEKQKDISNWKKFFIEVLNCTELSQKQDIFTAKLSLFIDNQEEVVFVESHFKILQELSLLYTQRTTNNLRFDKQSFSMIKLKSQESEWLIAEELHLTSKYRPILDLQKDVKYNLNTNFISEEYNPSVVLGSFLKYIGVQSGFSIIYDESINVIQVKNSDYKQLFLLSERFKNRHNYLIQKYTQEQINKQTFLKDYVNAKYLELCLKEDYNSLFWTFIKKEGIKFISKRTSITNYGTNYLTHDNYIVHFLKTNDVTPNKNNELKKTTELYSHSLLKFINDNSKIPFEDFSKIIIDGDDEDEKVTLEEAIGIKTKFSPQQCVEILSRTENRILLKDIENLEIVSILEDYEPSSEEKDTIFLLNEKKEWKKINELCTTNDEELAIDSSQILHEVFNPLIDSFGISELSMENLVLKTNPEKPHISNEIKELFSVRAKFLAYKIDQSDYEEVESDILEKINTYDYYEVRSIEKVFSETNFSNIKFEINLYIDEQQDRLYYKDYWKRNTELIDFIFELIDNDNLKKPWFEKVIERWEIDEICRNLNDEFGELPEYIKPKKKKKEDGRNEPANFEYLNEVMVFIDSMREVEDLYDEEMIEDLKSIVESYKDHPQERRKSLNLLAKLKLCKRLGIEYDNDWEFNQVVHTDERYFIHSAKGAFAYIHPHELIKMRDSGYKMAIDYGTRDIRIYDSYSDIIELYQNYLMLYQGNPDADEVMRICEENMNKEKFHFLIVDREKQTEDARAILKILNVESYE